MILEDKPGPPKGLARKFYHLKFIVGIVIVTESAFVMREGGTRVPLLLRFASGLVF